MKCYLIVGASSGIGREIAIRLSGKDTILFLAARREEKLRQLSEELSGESIICPCDVTDSNQVDAVFGEIKSRECKLDGMVYTAGICFVEPAKITDIDGLKHMYSVNVYGFYDMCKHFYNPKISCKGSSIVGVSSYAAASRESGMSAYSMTKESMNVQAQVLAKEFIGRSIRVNTVMPAHVMSKMASESNDWTDNELAFIKSRQPLGIIPIEQVVNLIEFLLSKDSSYITGETLAISGGYQG